MAVWLAFGAAQTTPGQTPRQEAKPIEIVERYLKAIQGLDFRAAYQYISSKDRTVRDEKSYLRSEGAVGGFALKLAKKLADPMHIWVVKEKLGSSSVYYDIGYRVPAADEIAAQLFDWNAAKLNALPVAQQQHLLEAVDDLKKRNKIIAIDGREQFNLVLEKSGWKIFLDWPSRTRVLFEAREPHSGNLEVKFLRNDFLVKIDDPFQVDFTVKNRTDREILVALNHLFQPSRAGENVDMIACGSLAPLRLGPQATQSLSTNYILRGPTPKPARFSIIYDFTARQAVVKRLNVP